MNSLWKTNKELPDGEQEIIVKFSPTSYKMTLKYYNHIDFKKIYNWCYYKDYQKTVKFFEEV